MAQIFIDDQCILMYGSKLTSKEKRDLKVHLSEILALPKNQVVLTQRGKALLVNAKNAHKLITCPDCEGIPGPIPIHPPGGGGVIHYPDDHEGIPGPIPINPLGPGGGPIHDPDFILRSQTLNINGIGINNFEVYYR